MDIVKINAANELLAEKERLSKLYSNVSSSIYVGISDNQNRILIVRKNIEGDWYCDEATLMKYPHIKESIVNATKWYYEFVIKQIEAEIAEINRQILSL